MNLGTLLLSKQFHNLLDLQDNFFLPNDDKSDTLIEMLNIGKKCSPSLILNAVQVMVIEFTLHTLKPMVSVFMARLPSKE